MKGINSKLELSVIVPIFNEEGSIFSTLTSLSDLLCKNNICHEIIAVNDGSSDNSAEILNNLNIAHLNVINHPANRGYGASLKTAIKSATYPWILIIDADGTYPIKSLPDLFRHTSDYDMVIGARTGQAVHDTFPRKIGRSIVRRFASYVSGAKIEDINSGMRIFKKKHAEKFWHLFPDGFSFTSTITVASHTNKHRVKYVPIDYNKRKGTSSIKPVQDFVGFVSLITRLAIYYRPLKVFVPLSTMFFVTAIIVVATDYFLTGKILDTTFAILINISIQMIIFGLIAEMIVKKLYND